MPATHETSIPCFLRRNNVNALTLGLEQIEEYAVNHTTPLEPHLLELAQYARETVEMAGMLCGPMEGTLLRFLVGPPEPAESSRLDASQALALR